MTEPRPLSDAVLVHFYRAVVAHMDVWRQRMDATTNWAAATTAGMVTFSFGAPESPHFVLLIAVAFNAMFLLMESRRYQVFDLWRRRFRVLNQHMISPVLLGRGEPVPPETEEALTRVASDLGRTVPHLRLIHAVGHRIRRNYIYLFGVSLLSWLLKLDVHPRTAISLDELVARAAVGGLPGPVVFGVMGASVLVAIALALRAPSERMIGWAEAPSPIVRLLSRSRRRPSAEGELPGGAHRQP